MKTQRADKANELLAEEIGTFFADPLGFVSFAYPWGQPGPLEKFIGPKQWQADFLGEWGDEIRKRGFNGVLPVDPNRFSTVSGHGIGKSALCGFIVDFIMSTRPFCKGVVTANTAPQLETKTWAELAKWTKLLINSHWFRITSGRGAMKMVHVDYPEEWRTDGLAWREHKADAFAGQHAATSTSFYIFDEASSIAKKIFETARGGLTDGEPMEFLFGNGTQNTGYFFDTHHKLRHRYKCRNIDSRTVEGTNKEYLEEIIDDYGEESDTAKVRVRGMFPNRSMSQFVATNVVEEARKREGVRIPNSPLLMGVDVARFGDDHSVIIFRRGRDAKSIPAQRFERIDTTELALKVFEAAAEHRPERIYIDGAGVGGGVVDTCRALGLQNVFEVNFGAKARNSTDYRDQGTECWAGMADWFDTEVAIEDSDRLQEELTSRLYGFIADNKKFIEPKKEMKKRGAESPDWADALASTFALPPPPMAVLGNRQDMGQGVNYNPMDMLKRIHLDGVGDNNGFYEYNPLELRAS